ncbi:MULTISPECIES: class A sortase [Enterococcus]|uniref:Class A sortase n=1 Tax=Enterococcus faecium TaxID=1352 RepID=A0A242BKA8_ENTFC|nr:MULTISPECIES: class A sortase [Enterococcus]EME7220240.1 class A sortase [Enterococcus faecium]EME8123456.1 class A sortase [Enterococcus faecium]KAA0689734.1 class A sortase [Enterococcus faecium]MBK5027881.1 class A sortase [Enterococcus faecium]MBK5038439.1 class A sortase [Enterococcus faecium]
MIMIKRLVLYFFLPVLVIFSLTLWIYEGYNQLLKTPDTTVSLVEGQQQAEKNLPKSSPQTNDQREKITDAGMQVLVQARKKRAEIMGQAGIGRIAIPSENLDLPILNEITELNLSTGATMYFPERHLGEGNVVLASHNFSDADVLLHRIKNVKKGTEIYLTDFTNVWIYQVTVNKIIQETQTDVLEQPLNDETLVTLIRCEGGTGTNYRRVVQGILQKTMTITNLSTAQQTKLGISKKETKLKKESSWMSEQLALSIQMKRPTVPLILIVVLASLFLAVQGINFVRKN